MAAGRSAGLQELSLQDAYGSSLNAKFWTAVQTAGSPHPPEGSLTLVSDFLSQRPNKDAAAAETRINAALESLGRGLALSALLSAQQNTPISAGADRHTGSRGDAS